MPRKQLLSLRSPTILTCQSNSDLQEAKRKPGKSCSKEDTEEISDQNFRDLHIRYVLL